MALLLAAASDKTITEVITDSMAGALGDSFTRIPDSAKGHFASMAATKEVDMVDAKVAMRLAEHNVPSTFEVGTLFSIVEDEDDTASDESAASGTSAAGKAAKKKP